MRSVLGVHWKDWCWRWNSNPLATWCKELTHLKRPWCWERLRAGGEGDNRGWDGWMAPLTQWTWVWVSSGSWWWTGRPGVLQSMVLQRVGHDWATEPTESMLPMFLAPASWAYLNLFIYYLFVCLFIGSTTGLLGSQFPNQELNLGPWQWKPGILTTGPLRTPLKFLYIPMCYVPWKDRGQKVNSYTQEEGLCPRSWKIGGGGARKGHLMKKWGVGFWQSVSWGGNLPSTFLRKCVVWVI